LKVFLARSDLKKNTDHRIYLELQED